MPTTLVATAAPTDTRIADVDTWDGIAVTVALDSDAALLTNGAMVSTATRAKLAALYVTAPVDDRGDLAGRLGDAVTDIPLVWLTWDNATATGSVWLGSRVIGALITRCGDFYECGHVDTDGWARRCGTDLSADCQKCATAHEHGCRSCA